MKQFLIVISGFILVFSIVGFSLNKNTFSTKETFVSNCDTSLVYFKQQIAPILQSKCVSCHNVQKAKDEVMLDNYENLIKTIEVKYKNGVLKNKLESVIKSDFMPPEEHEKLSITEKKLVYKWIKQGMKNTSCEDVLLEKPILSEAAISYENTVKEILDAQCVGCHNSANADAGIDLTDISTLKSLAFNGLLTRVINHSEGVRAMPLNGEKLSETKIKNIESWINNGMK